MDMLIKTLSAITVAFPVIAAADQLIHDNSSHRVVDQHTATTSGYRAYLDPVTGRLSEVPPPGVHTLPLTDQQLYELSSSDINLVPEYHPDGSVHVDLKGRYRNASAATLDEQGNVRIHRFGGEIFAGQQGQAIEQKVLQQTEAAGDQK